MDFDFHHVAVPFRMQPGLERLPAGAAQLTALDPAHPLYTHKRMMTRSGLARLSTPGFDPGPAIEAIASQAQAQGLDWLPDGGVPLELAFEEDFAILEGDGGTVPWLSVCSPSHWAPEDKLGLSLAAIHAPVAEGGGLRDSAPALVRVVTSGLRWERWVWTVSPSPRHDQHPRRYARTAWPGTDHPQTFASLCWLRVERQTFLPVPGARQAVFTIRVQLQPLTQAIDSPEKALRLHDSLASMSEAVLEYKNLVAAKPPLLQWLHRRAEGIASQ